MTNQPQTQDSSNSSTNQAKNDGAPMLSAIKKTWDKLSDEDIKLHETQQDQFFSKIREKHGITRDEAQKRLEEIKSTCSTSAPEKAA